MAEMKVSEMIEAEQVNDEDLIMIVQNGVNKKVPASKVGTGQAGGDTLPIGAIMPFGSDTIPENWLLCNGDAVSRTDYQELFNTIGITYGSGDGFTTFNLPDLQGKIPVGKDENDTDFDTLGNTGGEKTHTLTLNELPNNVISTASTGTNADGYIARGGYTTDGNYNFGGQGQSHNIVQPYIVQNYIIKAKQSSGVVATVVDGLNSTSTTDALSANQGKVLKEKLYSVVANGTNIDNLKTNGKYGMINATGTLPSGYSTSDNNIIIECIMWSNLYGRQILHDIRGDSTYMRRLSNGTWQTWRRFTFS
ncbi:tail fiber protein [Faecalibacillus faecis]|uniref:tail fiber protein n=1 Tax=Faecalibacillus faecis TaxID=1982628 RepID=UPI00386FEF97